MAVALSMLWPLREAAVALHHVCSLSHPARHSMRSSLVADRIVATATQIWVAMEEVVLADRTTQTFALEAEVVAAHSS